MSKKINTTSLGLFIVIGVALGVLGVLLFSSSKFFSNTQEVIVYFDGSLNGLNEGAPVKFRGVTIGSVQRVMVQYNQATNDFAMPVILLLEEELLRARMPGFGFGFTESLMEERIALGLRASLQTESLVTGVLYVGLDMDREAGPPVYHQLEKIYPEVPSVPTPTQQLFDNLASLDVKRIETNLNRLLANLDSVIGQLKVAEINQGVTNLLASLNRLANLPDFTNAIASVPATLEPYRLLGEKLNSRVDPVTDSLTNSLAEANETLREIRGAGENLRVLLAPDSPLLNELELALRQLASASQSLSELVDFLKRHPNAVITGRELNKEKP